jgi:hypothetical protein
VGWSLAVLLHLSARTYDDRRRDARWFSRRSSVAAVEELAALCGVAAFQRLLSARPRLRRASLVANGQRRHRSGSFSSSTLSLRSGNITSTASLFAADGQRDANVEKHGTLAGVAVGTTVRLRPRGPVLYASAYSALVLTVGVTLASHAAGQMLDSDLLPVWAYWPLLALGLIYGISRISIEVSDDEIVVRNFWRTHRRRWAEIREVGVASGWRAPLAWIQFLSALLITDTKGRRIIVQASLNRPVPDGRVHDALRKAAPDIVRWRVVS